MNKQEIAVVVALFLLLLGWFFVQQRYLSPPPAKRPMPAAQAAPSNAAPLQVEAPTPPALRPAPVLTADPRTNEPAAAAEAAEKHETLEPQRLALTNSVARVTISSWGGGIEAVELKKYRVSVDRDSRPVVLDFAGRPALSLSGLAGLTTNNDFTLGVDGQSVRIERATAEGIRFERTIVLEDGYRLDVTDAYRNEGSAALMLPPHGVRLGAMELMEAKPNSMGISFMGIDTLEDKGGVEVRHWGGKELPALFGVKTSFMSCTPPNADAMPTSVAHKAEVPIAWTAVKNRYFVEILRPDGSGTGCELQASRSMAAPGAFLIGQASADMLFSGRELKPGETFTRKMTYYAGPKEYSSLKPLGDHQDDVMEFGWFEWFRWLCKVLLWTLNALHAVIPNYGIAIILLTLIVRVIFWPVTHKSTESMKKMQQIQPLVNELRAKYKEKPQKMNEEVMALYKKHKVNPLAGCLPMLVQIPVFIALFIVLRSAVELRFAPFLWIRDLSEPEGILAGVLPFGGLNILPLLMTATTIWQQKITPSTMDPQQQKLMMFMPVVMLFLFYNMASALVLYWTVSQVLAIVQLVWQKKDAAAKEAVKSAKPA